jgi:predicted nuclease of predicted toxin-antitoxin system
MRFLADMGVARRIVEWLRAEGHDAVHLREEGLQRLPNGEIFEKAISEGRIVLTFDLDFGEIIALSGDRRTCGTSMPRICARAASSLSVCRTAKRALRLGSQTR